VKYKILKINKRNGKFRSVYSVNSIYKEKLKELLPFLEQRLYKLNTTNVNYAFEKGKNCVSGALQHIGYKYTLSMDLTNFFDSVKESHVSSLLDKHVINTCFIDGAPRQGLPTSPQISNIAFLKCDQLIIDQLNKHGVDCVYTRYADDLIFSFDEKRDRGKIQFIVTKAVEIFGFTININKTKFQNYKNGRRIITGVAVDNIGVHPTRKTRRRMRAAAHQGNDPQLNGLLEWSKCKIPKMKPASPLSTLPSKGWGNNFI
jgi:hypothetical protein